MGSFFHPLLISISILLCAFLYVGDANVIRVKDHASESDWSNNEEIEIFREYLRIPTISTPDVDYKPAVEFLKKQAASLDLPVSIYYAVSEQKPVVVMTWKGSQPELPSIMLNSHMDVVPVDEKLWSHPPFAAEIDDNGDIYARGAQDMKCVGTQYLAAIRALKRLGIKRLKRTIYVVFVPDEEIGGAAGMAGFVKTNEFKAMNVGLMLDEGMPLENEEGALFASYGQRSVWTVEFIVKGTAGHGSRLLINTPGEKMTHLLAKLNEFRDEEMRKFMKLKHPYGNVTTINLTIIKGGVQYNVIPSEMRATFDIRVSVNSDLDDFEQQVNRWCGEIPGCSINYQARGVKEAMTTVDKSNPFWVAFKNAVDKMEILVKPNIFVASSDARFVRRLNISALGFSPLINTIPRLHDNDEYINAKTYLKGIEVYKEIILSVSNL